MSSRSWATHSGTYESVLEHEGIFFERVPPFMSRARSQAFVAANRRDVGLRRFLRFYDTDELRAHVRGEIALFRRHAVRAVLTGWTLSTALSTRAAGVPLATSHLGCLVPAWSAGGRAPRARIAALPGCATSAPSTPNCLARSPRIASYLDSDVPTGYVAQTSTRKDHLSAVCAALRALPVRAVLVSTVHDLGRGLGPNVLVRSHLPSHAVMALVDLAIIHGGQGSVQTAIAAGVPVVGLPLHGEQYLNLKLIQRHGAGRCLWSPNTATRPRFGQVVARSLADASLKANMQRVQALQARYDGSSNSAQAVRQLAQTPVVRRPRPPD